MSNKGDCIIGGGIVALAALVWAEASRFSPASSGLGAGGFPRFIAICLGILGTILTVTSYIRWKKNKEAEVQVLKLNELLGAGILGVAFWAYVAVVTPLGYIPATIIFSFVFMLIFGERKWVRMTAVSIGFAVISYYLFRNVFYIMLPAGRLF